MNLWKVLLAAISEEGGDSSEVASVDHLSMPVHLSEGAACVEVLAGSELLQTCYYVLVKLD
jgi:hypothetical protein